MSEPKPRESERKRFNLHSAYKGEEEKLLAALRTGREVAGHPVAQGQGTESNWHAVLVDVLPKRYQVSTGFVVDSHGNQSDQIDLIIRDAHFSPLFWEFGGFLYVPAESVYAAFEVKQTINRENVLYASDKVASVRRLHRTSASFAWARGNMEARQLPPILGGLLVGGSDWTPAFGGPFSRALTDCPADGKLDLGCVLGHGSFEVDPASTGIAKSVNTDTALVSFTLTLLKRLQGLGSAPAIDYDAYSAWVSSQSHQPTG
jgi:hypothetical protein